jgi:hypothetical protein
MTATLITGHFATGHIDLFKRAAKQFNVSILVRRTNARSISYIGKARYVPKPLTCKAKTAKRDVFLGNRWIRCAGLVVDPRISGFRAAFESAAQHRSAVKMWDQEFKMRLTPDKWQYGWDREQSKYVHVAREASERENRKFGFQPVNVAGRPIREAKKFHVDDDFFSEHFGCVMYGSNAFSASYMHGDYDLYGIVDMEKPAHNPVTRGRMFGKEYNLNNFGPHYEPVARFLNDGFSALHGRTVAMIRHGSQEKYAPSHGEEELDVFWPDGSTSYVEGESAIWNLYKDAFANRRIGTRVA